MKKLSLLLSLLVCISSAFAAPQSSDNRQPELRKQVEKLELDNQVLLQHVGDLEARIAAANNSLSEHRYKETWYGDLIGRNVSIFAVIIGLMGAGFGLISWKRYNTVDSLMDSTVKELKKQFNEALDRHREEETDIFKRIEEDRVSLRIDMGNAYVMLSHNDPDNRISLVIYILQLTGSECETTFFESLCKEQQESILTDETPKVLLARLNSFNQSVDRCIQAKLGLNQDFMDGHFKSFTDLHFTDKLPNYKECDDIRKKIIRKIENYWEQQVLEEEAAKKATKKAEKPAAKKPGQSA